MPGLWRHLVPAGIVLLSWQQYGSRTPSHGWASAWAATGAPVRVAGQLMDQLAVPAQGDLAGQFTRDVPLPQRRRGLTRLVPPALAGTLTTALPRVRIGRQGPR